MIDKRDGILYPLDHVRRSEWAVVVAAGDGKMVRLWTAQGLGNDQARAAAFVPNRSACYVVGFIQLRADFSGFDRGNRRFDLRRAR